MATQAQKDAVARYDAKNTVQIHLKLNIKTDEEILRKLAKTSNVQGYIKELIKADIEKNG